MHFTWFYWDWMGFGTWFDLVSTGFYWFFCVLLGFTGFYLVLLDLNGFTLVLFIGFRRFEPRDGGFHGFLRGFLGFVPLTSHCDRVGTGFQGFQPLHWSGSVGWFGFDGHSIKFYGRASWWNRKRVLSRLPGLIGFDRVWSGGHLQYNSITIMMKIIIRIRRITRKGIDIDWSVRWSVPFLFVFCFGPKIKKEKKRKRKRIRFSFRWMLLSFTASIIAEYFFYSMANEATPPTWCFFSFISFSFFTVRFFFVGSLIIRFISLLYCRFSFIADSSDVNQQLPLQKKEKNKKKTAGAPNQSGFGFFFSLFF